MVMADFHTHTTFSDGTLSLPELIDWYGTRGARVLAITDHWCQRTTPLGRMAKLLKRTLTPDSLPRYIELLESEARRAWHQYQMRIIPGVELTQNTLSHHRSAHLVVLARNGWDLAALDPDHTPLEACMVAKRLSMLVIAAHPVSTGKILHQTYHLWDNRKLYAPYIDAWECATQERFFPEVATSGLPVIANSDFHSPRQAEAWRTRLNLSPAEAETLSIGSLFDAIRARRLQPVLTDWREPKALARPRLELAGLIPATG